jgi:hypothetical protein
MTAAAVAAEESQIECGLDGRRRQRRQRREEEEEERKKESLISHYALNYNVAAKAKTKLY